MLEPRVVVYDLPPGFDFIALELVDGTRVIAVRTPEAAERCGADLALWLRASRQLAS